MKCSKFLASIIYSAAMVASSVASAQIVNGIQRPADSSTGSSRALVGITPGVSQGQVELYLASSGTARGFLKKNLGKSWSVTGFNGYPEVMTPRYMSYCVRKIAVYSQTCAEYKTDYVLAASSVARGTGGDIYYSVDSGAIFPDRISISYSGCYEDTIGASFTSTAFITQDMIDDGRPMSGGTTYSTAPGCARIVGNDR
jgi:hypothetical protein